MKNSIIILILIFQFNAFSQTQRSESENIERRIDTFFEALHQRDSSALRLFFAPQVNMVSIFQNKNDSTIIRYENVEKFLKAVGTKDENDWVENTSNFRIEIDQNLAQVWCDYQFILNGKFSHCGVDAFHLLKINNQWRITHLADTRKRSNCK